jgi:two-component system response regulator (stage 0 sporulation protein F)
VLHLAALLTWAGPALIVSSVIEVVEDGQIAVMKVPPPARILVIDDNLAVIDILATCLGEEGHTISSALTSDEGLKLVILSRPDLVLLDVALPGMNGIEVLKRIRAISPAIGVIMVTGNTDPQLAREAIELGALAYVDKPFDLTHLRRVVVMALQPETERPGDQSRP